MRIGSLLLLIVFSGLLSPAPTAAHSFAAFFDGNAPFSVTGTVEKVDWVTPDVFIHVRVEDKATGQTTVWAFETLPPRVLTAAYKLTSEMFKVGTPITVLGWPERQGANLAGSIADPVLAARVRAESAAYAAQFEFPDGRIFPVVTSVPEIPAP